MGPFTRKVFVRITKYTTCRTVTEIERASVSLKPDALGEAYVPYKEADDIIKHLQEKNLKLVQAAEKMKSSIVTYKHSMDKIYNHNEAARYAVVKHFGTTHPYPNGFEE